MLPMTAKYPTCPNSLRLSVPLLANCFMPVSATPFRDALESAPKAVRGSLLLYDPKSLAGHGPCTLDRQR
jgi:hypothetical protein